MRFLHVRNYVDSDFYDPIEDVYYTAQKLLEKGGCTFAYKVTDNKIQVSKALCSPRDNYCKHIGRDIATGRFIKGHITTLELKPKLLGGSVIDQIIDANDNGLISV